MSLEEQIRERPKVLLHDHLDSSLSTSTLIELADGIGHELPSTEPGELAAIFRAQADSGSLVAYLEPFAHLTAVLQDPESLRRVAREYVETLAEDGVVYAEPRWAPEQHLGGGLSLDEAVEAVQAGLDEGTEVVRARGRTVIVGQLLCAMRMNDRATEIARLALRHRHRGVVGFDIAGPEVGYPPSRFAEAFTLLAEAMFPVTVHAGEAVGVESIREALVTGRAQRLGHGIRVIEDPTVGSTGGHDEPGEVARWVLDRQVHLETSPTSNLHTGAVAALTGRADNALSDHPFDLLDRLGFNVGVNTDNRIVSGVTLTGELTALAETFGYGLPELGRFQRNALDASFLDHARKRELAALIREAWR